MSSNNAHSCTSRTCNFDQNYHNYPACVDILVKNKWVTAAVSSANGIDSHLYQLPSVEIEIIPLASFSVVPTK